MDRKTLSKHLSAVFNNQHEMLASLPKGELKPNAITYHAIFHNMRYIAYELNRNDFDATRLAAFSRQALMHMANLLANEVCEIAGENSQLVLAAVRVVRDDRTSPVLRTAFENLSPACALISKVAAVSRQALALSAQ